MTDTKKSVLVITYGPVPTPEYKTIEGGGMRAWGLAKGLFLKGFDVTVAVNEGFVQTIGDHEHIKVVNWTLNDSFKDFINSFDVVIASYCMGDLSMYVADNISDSVLLVLDAYVPIYVEVSARNSSDVTTELTNYSTDLQRFNHVLRRGDYFLCANKEQLDFYTGVLSSLGVLNPATYQDDRLLVVPFGIHKEESLAIENDPKNPYTALGMKKDTKILLWFGGLYPWFNFKPLLSAVEKTSTLIPSFAFVVVGGKNPFNGHPDFVKQYDFVKNAVEKNSELKKVTHFVDWVDYDQRLIWYRNASLVVSINSDGKENHFAWRTRIMDYLTAQLPILTNGGDPLSDLLIEKGAAVKMEESRLPEQLLELLDDKNKRLSKIRVASASVGNTFHWEDVIKPLVLAITSETHPQKDFKKLATSLGIDIARTDTAQLGISNSKITVLRSYYAKAKNKGIKRSVKFAAKIGVNYARSKFKNNAKRDKQVFFLSHPIDETGAPLVLLDIAYDFSKHFKPHDINIVAPGIKPHMEAPLRRHGFSLHKMAMGISKKLIHAQLDIQPDDFVLMNTVALYDEYRRYVYWLLDTKRLKHAVWFIHEDNPGLRFKNKLEIKTIERLINVGLLSIRVPSSQTAAEYNNFFHTKNVSPVDLRVSVPEKYVTKRSEDNFNTINFALSGSPEDGRKGQLLFLSALQYFESRLKKSTTKYRDYSVNFVAIGDDYISQQINIVGEAILGDHFHAYPKMPKDDALKIISTCNVTVCASLNETFALFVAEGMIMGHPIIRNRSSGWKEQMIDGKNGYLFNEDDLRDFAEKIEMILNINKSSNAQLLSFGNESQSIIERFVESNYFDQLSPTVTIS